MLPRSSHSTQKNVQINVGIPKNRKYLTNHLLLIQIGEFRLLLDLIGIVFIGLIQLNHLMTRLIRTLSLDIFRNFVLLGLSRVAVTVSSQLRLPIQQIKYITLSGSSPAKEKLKPNCCWQGCQSLFSDHYKVFRTKRSREILAYQ